MDDIVYFKGSPCFKIQQNGLITFYLIDKNEILNETIEHIEYEINLQLIYRSKIQ